MNAGGYMHHDDLVTLEASLLYAAQLFEDSLRLLEIGTWSGDTSRSINTLLKSTKAAKYTHICIDKQLEPGAAKEPPFPGTICHWIDSIEAAPLVGDNLGLIIVDGCHCLYHVLADFALYSQKLRSGGLILFHDCNPKSDKTQYQYHGDINRHESHISVLTALNVFGLWPLVRSDYELFMEGKDGGSWCGQFLVFKKK